MKDFFFFVIGLVIIFGSIFLFLEKNLVLENETRAIKINGSQIIVEVAETAEAWQQGLSGRESLEEGRGMLFIFENPDIYSFWMKDMNFPIDIVWIDEHLVVVGLEKDVLPETYPETFLPNQPIKYVLEIPAGASEEYGIEIGDSVIQ